MSDDFHEEFGRENSELTFAMKSEIYTKIFVVFEWHLNKNFAQWG